MSVIILFIYVLLMAAISIWIVHPLANKGVPSFISNKIPLPKMLKDKYLNKAFKQKVLFQWYSSIIILGFIIVGIAFILESTIMPQYSVTSIMTWLFEDPNKEEDDKYDWQFDDTETPGEGGEQGGTYINEAETFVEIAVREYTYYSSNNIVGGQKYWDWWRQAHGTTGSGGWHWCANFVTYCASEAGLCEDGGTIGSIDKLGLSCTAIRNRVLSGELTGTYHIARKSGGNITWTDNEGNNSNYIPQPGDIALYSDSSGSVCGHVGIVVDVSATGEVITIGGNEGGSGDGSSYYYSSKVKKLNRGVAAMKYSGYNYVMFYTPNWKITQTSGSGGTVVGNFDLGYYQKGPDGYYSQETTKQIVYDFLRLELGYNSAVASGILSNMQYEGGFEYDKMEVANDGRAYVTKDTSSKYYVVPSPSNNCNGNWVGIQDIETTLLYEALLYYKKPTEWMRYGMGFGLVQWSFDRRTALFNYGKSVGLGDGRGPDGLAAQLAYLKYEITEGCRKKVGERLEGIPDTADGCFDAGYYWAEYFEGCSGGDEAFTARGNNAKNNYWPVWGGKMPSAGVTSPDGSPASSDISNAVMIGDSNTVRMYSYSTDITKAKKIFATVGIGLGSFDSYSSSQSGSSTILGKTIKQAIDSCSSDDLSHVVIMLGTNDYGKPDSVASNYQKLLDCISSKNNKAVVTICTVPPVNDSASSTIKNSNAVAINDAIKKFVSSYSGSLSVHLLDVNSQLTSSDMSTTSGDGYHFSKSGASKCASYIVTNVY